MDNPSNTDRLESFGPDAMTYPPVSPRLSENSSYLRQTLHSRDIVFREFTIHYRSVQALLVGVEGLFDKEAIQQNVIQPLLGFGIDRLTMAEGENEPIDTYLEQSGISLTSIDHSSSIQELLLRMMKGSPLLFVDGLAFAYILNAPAFENRSIQEPVTETVVRGPREGFVEALYVNISMVRRKLAHPGLVVEPLTIGTDSRTDIALIYLAQTAEPSVVAEVRERLSRIRIDGILESGQLEELIEDAPRSLFPTISNTQRPDVVASRLLEGRVAILTDGTPEALVVPYLFFESFRVAEDYYSRYFFSSFLRLLRFFFFLVSTIGPGLYVASLEYHYEFMPTDLLISIASAREKVPFSVFIEMLLLLVIFELIREAGVRMPRPIGQAVSIVGALIIGETAVEAGFVSAPTTIIAALSGISSLLVVPLSDVGAFLKFVYLVSAASFGMYGIMLVFSLLILYIASLRSFGVPYTSPYFPSNFVGWRDFLLRFPLWARDRIPSYMPSRRRVRQNPDQRPGPPEEKRP